MPIEVQCGRCRKRYRVGEQLIGKKVKCKGCGSLIAVQAGSTGMAASGPPVGDESDPFDMAALAAVEESGQVIERPVPPRRGIFVKQPSVQIERDESTVSERKAPARSSAGSSRAGAWSSNRSRSRPSSGGQDYTFVAIAVYILAFVGIRIHFVGLANVFVGLGSARGLGVLLMFFGFPFMLVGGIMGLVTAFRESAGQGVLYLFVPFYQLFYVITRWSEMQRPFFQWLCGFLLMFLGRYIVEQSLPPAPVVKAPTIQSPFSGNDSRATDSSPPPPQPNGSASSDGTSRMLANNSGNGSNPEGTPTNSVSGTTPRPTDNAPKQRLTADGKPIPPPPDDLGESYAATAFGDDDEKPVKHQKHAMTVPTVVRFLAKPPMKDVEELRAAPVAGPWVFGRTGTTWKRYNIAEAPETWKPSGQVDLTGGRTSIIFSPNGEYLVRTAEVGQPVLQSWSFITGEAVQSIDGKGVAALVGFLTNELFVVAGGNNAMLVVVNARTGQKVREMPAPVGMTFKGPECSISADGALIAAPAQADPAPLVLLYNSGGGVNKRIALPAASKGVFKSFDTLEGSAFSKDGRKLAVIGESQRTVFIHICGVAEGRVLATFEYPSAGFFGMRETNGPLVQWLGETGCLLYRNSIVIDGSTGRVIGCTDREVAFFHDSGLGNLLMTHHGEAFGDQLDAGALDMELITSRLAEAKAAGPMRFEWPAATGAKFAAQIGPKSGDAKPGMTPDPAPIVSNVTKSPVAIDAPYQWVRQVLFGRAGGAAAVLALAPPGSGRGEWSPLSDADFRLQRIDLTTGKTTAPIHLPIFSKLMGISPDGNLAVIASDGGDHTFPLPNARLDVVSVSTGKPVVSFVPYADAGNAAAGSPAPAGAEKVFPQTVTWAALADNDGLLTLNGGQMLVRWSIGGRRAVWARTNVTAPPVFSPGGKYVTSREQSALLVLDVKTGDAVASLPAEPIAGADMKFGYFSRDGESFYAGTSAGLFRWDVKTGQVTPPLTTESFDTIDDLGPTHLLLNDRLFDLQQGAFVYNYPVFGGRHLGGGPTARHWYIARMPLDASVHLCSALLPTADHLAKASKLAADAPLIRPGKQVSLQVSAGGATEKITQALTAKLKARGLDQGEVVATLRVTAQESATGEEASYGRGMNPFVQDPNAEKVSLQKYECWYDLVDAQEHVLYGSQTSVFRSMRSGGYMLKQGETVAAKMEEQLVRQVESWGSNIRVPAYLRADGKPAQRPETVLNVPAKKEE